MFKRRASHSAADISLLEEGGRNYEEGAGEKGVSARYIGAVRYKKRRQ